jgi:hypothetical protein
MAAGLRPCLRIAALLLSALIPSAVFVPSAHSQAVTPATGQSFISATPNGAWSFFTDPRAVYYKGASEKVYLGFMTSEGHDRIWSYDYALGKIDTFTLHRGLEVDDHDNPALYVHPDGRLTAIYQRHTVDLNIYLRTTTKPEDITAWGPERMLKGLENTTYANPFRLDDEDGRVYLFNREVEWHPTMRTSDDQGATWSAPRQVVGGSAARPYIKYRGDGQSKIHLAFTDGHPRDVPNNSIYYAYYSGGNFYKASGERIKAFDSPLEPSQAERIYNGATSGRAWIWDVALDKQGRAVMVFAVAPSESDHRYYYARWTGTSWLVKEMCKAGRWFPQTPSGQTEREPHYSGGIILNPQDPSEVFLSRPPDGATSGTFEIEDWTTPDGGTTWTSRKITSGSSANNVRPILPWPVQGQANPRRMVFWMHGKYVHYTDYDTGIKYAFLDPPVSNAVPGGSGNAGPVRLPLSAWEAAGFDPLGRRLPMAPEVPLPGAWADPGKAGSGPPEVNR